MLNLFKGQEFIAPPIRPAFNIGCLFDIPQGTYVKGIRGEMVLMGGQSFVTSFTGPGNSFKTDLVLFPTMTCLDRYPSHRAVVYDTENSLKYTRFNRIAMNMPNLRGTDFAQQAYSEDPLLMFMQKADLGGEKWFDLVKDMSKEKQKNARSIMRTLPIRDSKGDMMQRMAATHAVCDSLSAFSVASVDDKIVDKNEIGDAKNNTMFMKDGAAKTQMIIQLPNVTVQGDVYFSCTAHIGNRIEMDPYAPKPIELTFSKNGAKAKGVPEKFQYINDHLVEVLNTKPLKNQADKAPLFPLIAADREEGNDLFLITAVNSRNKGGQSGIYFPIVVSQTEGIKVGLTEYLYLKENKKFGIGGNDRRYHLDLYPDVTMERTTIRRIIEENPKVKRALEFTSEMLQMRKIWRNVDENLHVEPAEVFDRIAKQGYDIEQLLDTRGYWMYLEDEEGQKPFLSTLDLLRVAAGEYHPYFLKDDKKTLIEEHWKIGDRK
ncbi:hypothetical protein [Vibrio phage vB_VmeM-Yong XC32]|nr:hypothetical protein [Vibrio phage vB_VmeM-Yong XC31]QAX96464.1 hypothetical protein [Vibrio phage vB_VmeM-Yong XC32]QAX96781.1 hypothetical protein [Vibrio phage vB_VmeM-Yong MS31]QAX97100.1 hypothetical protein [Vibrio phage vB_VmeM-Yong MS32]